MSQGRKSWSRTLSLCVALAATVGGCAGPAANVVPLGMVAKPGNVQIPLPAGQWQLLASKSTSAGRVIGGGIDNQHSVEVEYGRVEGGVLTALADVVTSADALPAGGYGTGLACINQVNDDYLYFKDVRGSSINSIDCTRVMGRVFNEPSARSSDMYREMYDKAKALGGVPRNGVEVSFAEAHNLRFMNYTIWFFPERAGVPVKGVSWRSDKMTEPASRFVAGIVDWAKQFHNAIWLGLNPGSEGALAAAGYLPGWNALSIVVVNE